MAEPAASSHAAKAALAPCPKRPPAPWPGPARRRRGPPPPPCPRGSRRSPAACWLQAWAERGAAERENCSKKQAQQQGQQQAQPPSSQGRPPKQGMGCTAWEAEARHLQVETPTTHSLSPAAAALRASTAEAAPTASRAKNCPRLQTRRSPAPVVRGKKCWDTYLFQVLTKLHMFSSRTTTILKVTRREVVEHDVILLHVGSEQAEAAPARQPIHQHLRMAWTPGHE